MAFDSYSADIRFGCGLSPTQAPPASVTDILDRLSQPDVIVTRYPIPTWSTLQQQISGYRKAKALRNEAKKRPDNAEEEARLRKAFNALQNALRADQQFWLCQALLRRAETSDGFRERLSFFWADHFTTLSRAGVFSQGSSPFAEEALRPNLTGRFGDMLVAVAKHPMMLEALDQWKSVGPDSRTGQRRQGKVGLNENFARELMELHTLGSQGPYTQDDVRQLAMLLTGLTFTYGDGFGFNPAYVEPGIHTVLGKSYGGPKGAHLEDIEEVLHDLAVHPATAAYLSRKLAAHFVSDSPSQDLIDHMSARYRDTDGHLLAVYEALLEHPDAWADPVGGNVKQPLDFLGSSFRALGLTGKILGPLTPVQIQAYIVTPMELMGQKWEQPTGPDGWSEADDTWITAQRYAARLQWAANAPLIFLPELPDPRQVLKDALGPYASEDLSWAAAAAQTRSEGLTLVLAAPAFQRM